MPRSASTAATRAGVAARGGARFSGARTDPCRRTAPSASGAAELAQHGTTAASGARTRGERRVEGDTAREQRHRSPATATSPPSLATRPVSVPSRVTNVAITVPRPTLGRREGREPRALPAHRHAAAAARTLDGEVARLGGGCRRRRYAGARPAKALSRIVAGRSSSEPLRRDAGARHAQCAARRVASRTWPPARPRPRRARAARP